MVGLSTLLFCGVGMFTFVIFSKECCVLTIGIWKEPDNFWVNIEDWISDSFFSDLKGFIGIRNPLFVKISIT